MKLTRAQLRGELRTLEAQHRADRTTIDHQVRIIAHTRTLLSHAQVESAPTLAENIRLAHLLEQSETLRAQAEQQVRELRQKLGRHTSGATG